MEKRLDQLETSTDIINFLKNKAYRHNSYKKYDSYNIKNVDHCHLFLTDGSTGKWDDIKDRESICNNDKKIYVSSFCCQTNENVAMWKIYGKYMLNIKKSQMQDLKNNIIKIELLHSFDDETDRIELENSYYDLELIDVIYHGDSNGTINLTYQEKHGSVSEKEFNKIKKSHKYVIKNHAYYNERECRLILSIKGKKEQFSNFHVARIKYRSGFITRENIYVSPGNWNYEGKCNHSKLEGHVDLKGFYNR